MGNSIECEPSNSSQDDGNILAVKALAEYPDAQAIEVAKRRAVRLNRVIIPALDAMQSPQVLFNIGNLFIR